MIIRPSLLCIPALLLLYLTSGTESISSSSPFAQTLMGSKTQNPAISFKDCPAGWYCPIDSVGVFSHPCPQDSSVYCPEKSSRPLPTPRGYYAFGNRLDDNVVDGVLLPGGGGYSGAAPCKAGEYCDKGVRHLCPGGRYGSLNEEYRSNCTGVCRAGHYCPPGSTTSTQNKCGADFAELDGENPSDQYNVYCPEGSAYPTVVDAGFYTIDAYHTPWFNQSIQSYEYRGYPNDSPREYLGDLPTDPLFAIDRNVSWVEKNASIVDIPRTKVNQTKCEPGYYCVRGIKKMCGAGRYGSEYGLTQPECTGICGAGYYCPEGSISPTQHPCGASNVFCPRGSSAPQIVSKGYYTINGYDDKTRFQERKCEFGFFCSNGVKTPCPAGWYGGEMGIWRPNCTGLCAPGYYCPSGSISSTEVKCGDASLYCPEGSPKPKKVPSGHFSTGVQRVIYETVLGRKQTGARATWEDEFSDEATRSDIAIAMPGFYALLGSLFKCPAGFYGAESALSTSRCSGPCSIPGYYCPEGSISPFMKVCGGDNFYCSPSTVAPIRVPRGFYTADYMTGDCGPGYYRNWTSDWDSHNGTASPGLYQDPTQHDSSLFVTERIIPECQLCPFATFKTVVGDAFSLCLPCDNFSTSYKYGIKALGVSPKSNSNDDRTMCECQRITKPGYVVHFNISSGTCDSLPSFLIPQLDMKEWVTNTSLTRYVTKPCEIGHSCRAGQRYLCPAGYYGGMTKETRPLCQGMCEEGYYCPIGSVSPYSVPCGQANLICPTGSQLPIVVDKGFYSNEDAPENLRYQMSACPLGYFCPGDGRRYPCPAGTYSDTLGEYRQQCKGPCDQGYYCELGSSDRQQNRCGGSSVYCPRGSSSPKVVHDGFYCIHTGIDGGEQEFWDPNIETCSAEVPCEPGYYCERGIRRPCPPGTFGWRHGLKSSECVGQCAPGYYCPSILEPQPDAPPHTLWPKKPHIHAAQLECGGTDFYCPAGSKYPQYVSSGYYSLGGGYGHGNMTRSQQEPCRPGSYCLSGVEILCPPGTYGSETRLTHNLCTGWCPAGFYCPAGAPTPIPCPEGFFSVGAAALCKACPGKERTTPMPCKNERTCCFRGM